MAAQERRAAARERQRQAQLEEQERAKQAAEAAIARMEEEERQLIERLKQSQAIQRKAYHELEVTLLDEGGAATARSSPAR